MYFDVLEYIYICLRNKQQTREGKKNISSKKENKLHILLHLEKTLYFIASWQHVLMCKFNFITTYHSFVERIAFPVRSFARSYIFECVFASFCFLSIFSKNPPLETKQKENHVVRGT